MNVSLIHPQTVVLELQSRASVNKDDEFKELVQHAGAGEVLTISAQVSYGSTSQFEQLNASVLSGAKGYLVAKFSTVNSRILAGDKITSISGVAVEYRIREVIPAGHYSDGPHILLFVFVEDRV